MDNENLRDNERINEEIFDSNDTNEEIFDSNDTNEEIFDSNDTDEVIAEENDAAEVAQEQVTETETGRTKKVNKKTIIIVASAVVAFVAAVVIYCTCVMNGVGVKSIVNSPEFFEDRVAFDVKYENPVMTLFDKIVLGSADGAVLKVNDKAVSKNTFDFYLNYVVSGYINNYASEKFQGQSIEQQEQLFEALKGVIEEIDFGKTNEKTGLTLQEELKAGTVEAVVPLIAFINEGEKRGIVLSESEVKEIKDGITQLKAQYGSDFGMLLNASGFSDEETYIELMKMMSLMQRVSEDFEKDPTKYISEKELGKEPTVDAYIEYLSSNAKVKLKKDMYDSIKITQDDIMQMLGLE